MWICPVCNQRSETMLCAGCGFDGSCDLEHYPTLGVPSGSPVSIEKRKDQLEREMKNLLACPGCGQRSFRFDLAADCLICTHCRQQVTQAQIRTVRQARGFAAKEPPRPAQTDTAEALYKQAKDCYYGHGVPSNRVKAAELFGKAAELGHPAAQHSLGYCYQYGQGVPRNLIKAVEFYSKAAAQGHSAGQFNLGYCYYHGQGVGRNFIRAVEQFRKAAQQNNASAQTWLGGCYYYGRGVPQDYAQAVHYYRQAAQAGVAYAQKMLGDCYRNGHGVPQDNAKSNEYFRQISSSRNF